MKRKKGDLEEVVGPGESLLRQDPLRESICWHLMRLYAACGYRGAISRTYQICAALLPSELAIAPSIRTRKTYDWLIQVEDGPGRKTGGVECRAISHALS